MPSFIFCVTEGAERGWEGRWYPFKLRHGLPGPTAVVLRAPVELTNLPLPCYAEQRMEEPQNVYFPFSYFPLTKRLMREEIPPTI